MDKNTEASESLQKEMTLTEKTAKEAAENYQKESAEFRNSVPERPYTQQIFCELINELLEDETGKNDADIDELTAYLEKL